MKMFIKILSFLPIIFSVVFIACGDPKETEVSVSVNTIDNDTVIVQQASEPEKVKSDVEIGVVAAIKVLEIGRDIFKNMKTNDSIKVANREKMYAYQIGFAISDKDEVFDLYNKLVNTEDVYVLKQSRNSYFLISYNGNGEKALNDSLSTFENKIGQDSKVINLMTLCSKKEKLMRGEKLTKRKDDTEIPCLVCD